MSYILKYGSKKWALLPGFLIISPLCTIAQGLQPQNDLANPLAITLLLVIIFLLVAIGLLCFVVIGAARLYLERMKEDQAREKKNGVTAKVSSVMALMTLSLFVKADDPAISSAPSMIGGLQSSSFYVLVGVIGLEVLILMMLIVFLKTFLSRQTAYSTVPVASKKNRYLTAAFWKDWWNNINKFKPIREEKDIMLDHDYDGIRELDNKLPPWWLWGFYISIIFAGIYLFRFHVAHSAPSSIQEYEAAVAKAEIEKAEYLKKAANNVDETSVIMLRDNRSLSEGERLFTSNCAACHGAQGQGGVGPNLTDDYWLNNGDIKDIFKTIKYGVPEKGMKSWKDDFSPVQLAQLASFIKSIHNSNPPSPKEPQGELYRDGTMIADSTVEATIK